MRRFGPTWSSCSQTAIQGKESCTTTAVQASLQGLRLDGSACSGDLGSRRAPGRGGSRRPSACAGGHWPRQQSRCAALLSRCPPRFGLPRALRLLASARNLRPLRCPAKAGRQSLATQLMGRMGCLPPLTAHASGGAERGGEDLGRPSAVRSPICAGGIEMTSNLRICTQKRFIVEPVILAVVPLSKGAIAAELVAVAPWIYVGEVLVQLAHDGWPLPCSCDCSGVAILFDRFAKK